MRIDPTGQSIIIHFKDGNIQTGLLQSHLLAGKTIRYIPQSQMMDRRRVPRVSFIKEVTVDDLGVRRIVDLSTHGTYVETLIPHPVGSVHSISLRFGHEVLELRARVVFNDPGIGMGLEFVRLSTAARLRLETLVQHTLNSKEHHPRDRRARGDRRIQKHHENHKYRLRDLRKTDRRQYPGQLSEDTIEVEFSRLKSIFFLHQNGESSPRDEFLPPPGREVIVTFRDGEEIRGILTEISPEKPGFFIELPAHEKIGYTLYVIKAAVERIAYL